MPNPYGSIAGVSDVSEPGWQERLMEMVRRADASNQRTKNRLRASRLSTVCDPQMLMLVTAAARSRGMSTAAYIRRAVCAFAAADLEVEFVEVAKYGSMPVPYGTPSAKVTFGELKRTNDDGTGFGSWEVKR